MEDIYKDLITYLPDIVYQVDANGLFIYVNDSVRRLGYEPSDLIGKHFSMFISASSEEDTIDRDKLLTQKVKGERKVVNERRTGRRITKKLNVDLISRDGKSRIPAELFATGCFEKPDSGKKFSGTIGLVREKFEDRSGKVMAQIEQYYRLINDNSSETTFILAHDGTILSVSNSAEKNFTLVPFDLIGENMEDFIHEDDQIIFRGILSGKVHSSKGSRKVEFRLRGRDSIWFTCETSVSPVRDTRDQGVVCFILNAIDVTPRKVFEQAQERRERIYRTILRVSPDAIVLFDLEGDTIMSNDRASEIVGLAREDIIGMHYFELLSDAEKQRAKQIRDDLLRDGFALNRTLELVRPDGRVVPLECGVSSVRAPTGTVEGYLVIFRDVTIKRKAEMEKKKLEDSLLQIIVNRLSDREIELLTILHSGLSWPEDKKDVGQKMNALPGTLDQFVYRIRKKMEISDMETIVKIVALRFGWTASPDDAG
jgi:PAS domain S-box-containing protein